MADQPTTPREHDSHVVLPLRREHAADAGKRKTRTQGGWLTDHVRDLMADVDSVEAAPAVVPTALAVAAPTVASEIVVVDAAAPSIMPREVMRRVVGPAVARKPRVDMRAVGVESTRVPDERSGIRRVAVAATGGLRWRHRVARVAVAGRDPGFVGIAIAMADAAPAVDAVAVSEDVAPPELGAPAALPPIAPASVEPDVDPEAAGTGDPTAAASTLEPVFAAVVEEAAPVDLRDHTPTPSAVLVGAAIADAASIAAALAPPTPRPLAPAHAPPTAMASVVIVPVAPTEVTVNDEPEAPAAPAPVKPRRVKPDADQAELRRARRPHNRMRAARYVGGLIMAAVWSLALVACVLIMATVLTGHHPETVVTGSMVPNIPIGSMVISEKVPVDSLRPGDVLVFPRPINTNLTSQQDETIVHRIIAVTDPGDGKLNITTKGDANAAADCWNPPACPVSRDAHALADRVVLVLPGFGNAAAWLRLGAIAFVVFVLLSSTLGWGIRQIRKQLA